MKIVFIPADLNLANCNAIASNVNDIRGITEQEDFRLVELNEGKLYNIYNKVWLSYEYIPGKTRKVSYVEAYDIMSIGKFDVVENTTQMFDDKMYIGVIALVEDDWSINDLCPVA